MFIEDHMTRQPETIRGGTLLPEARRLLNECHFRHLPVVDEQGGLLGMVTDRDLRSAYPSSVLSEEERRSVFGRVEKTSVDEVMSTELSWLTPSSTLDDALLIFDREKLGALPVVDNDQVVGIFSIRDLISAYKGLFGVGEKGSALLFIRDDGREDLLRTIISILEEQKIPFTRLMRISKPQQKARIVLRINTFKLAKVHHLLADAGIEVVHA
ncbi:MAG: CBS domain-containing protein [Thermodesulfobacteriota bacterium]